MNISSYTGQGYVLKSSKGLYVPLFLRYHLIKPTHRFQPFVLGEIHTFIERPDLRLVEYENGQAIREEEVPRRNSRGIGAALGIGIQVKVISSFSLHGFLGANWVKQYTKFYTNNHLTITSSLGLGIVYRFK